MAANTANADWPADIVVVSAIGQLRGLSVDEATKSCRQIWEVSLVSGVARALVSAMFLDTLVVDDSLLYVASRGRVRCFEPKHGTLRWDEEPEGLNKGIFGAYDLAAMIPIGDCLLITAANMLVCVKKSNGIQVWSMKLDFMVKRDCFVLCLLQNNSRVAVRITFFFFLLLVIMSSHFFFIGGKFGLDCLL